MRVSLGRVMFVEKVEICGWLSLKFRETTMTTKKILPPVMLTGILGAGRVYLHTAHGVLHERLFHAGAVSMHSMLTRVRSFIAHKSS